MNSGGVAAQSQEEPEIYNTHCSCGLAGVTTPRVLVYVEATAGTESDSLCHQLYRREFCLEYVVLLQFLFLYEHAATVAILMSSCNNGRVQVQFTAASEGYNQLLVGSMDVGAYQ
ncbi:hypothetical protein OUZ56_023139 [Daphnia magna]|uniref:Uncharacterized protein n=1 Tax=Daphnia magna TaxID=35525 RepID=A0ABR0AYD9_9CRUS|nr:hypothetical protein OUZ56_023139 [Daphnia magna]